MAMADCRHALAVGLDVSGSVDQVEYRQQLDGLAYALTRPDVMAVLAPLGGRQTEIMVYEWAAQQDIRVLTDWRTITSEHDLTHIADDLRATARTLSSPETALGEALDYGLAELSTRRCDRLTLDLSADGPSNEGPRPRDIYKRYPYVDATVNGLAVVSPENGAVRDGDLLAYFRAEVLNGPNAFVEQAQGYDGYARAMQRKLLREMRALEVAVRQ